MQHLTIDNLTADYAGNPVLKGVSLDIPKGGVVSLIGPSGSGKSTILRVLVGLLKPTGGRICVDGQKVSYDTIAQVQQVRRKLAIVFQQYNLFQNMTALQNVTVAPIKIQKRNKAEVEAEAKALLEKVGLGHKLKAYPDQLSGGQQQRVAIARALALKPEILLLDEVTAALDPELVSEVLDIMRLLASEGMTMITVSHEMNFVRDVASQVAFLDGGRIVEIGTPDAVFGDPKHDRTRQFLSRILKH